MLYTAFQLSNNKVSNHNFFVNSFPDELKGMQLSDFRLKVFLCFTLVTFFYLFQLQMFNKFDKMSILPSSKSSVKSFTAKFHFFSAFSSSGEEEQPAKVTILVLAHNSVKVESIQSKFATD